MNPSIYKTSQTTKPSFLTAKTTSFDCYTTLNRVLTGVVRGAELPLRKRLPNLIQLLNYLELSAYLSLWEC